MSDCAEVIEIPLLPFHDSRIVWRVTSLRQYWHCTRSLLRQRLPEADVVIGGEHLFLKAHKQRFPEMPFIYFPHAPHVSHEIQCYTLPWLMKRMTASLYSRLQVWALNHADVTGPLYSLRLRASEPLIMGAHSATLHGKPARG